MTSGEWQLYHKKKELEKLKREKEKEERIEMRLLKKREYEEKFIEKNLKKSKFKKVHILDCEPNESSIQISSAIPAMKESFSDRENIELLVLKVDSYVLVKLKPENEKVLVFYVRQVLKIKKDDFLTIKSSRKGEKYHGSFIFPLLDDVSDIHHTDIVKTLPIPVQQVSTKRQKIL